MIQAGDKEIETLYYIDKEGVGKEVESVWLGEEQVWPEGESEGAEIHLTGVSYSQSGLANIYINGTKYVVDNINFDFNLNNVVWEYGVNKNSGFRNCVQSIKELTGVKVKGIKGSLSRLFDTTSSVTKLNMTGWDMSEITSLNHSFFYNLALTEFIAENWNVNNVTDMSYMFGSNSNLERVYIPNWNVKNVENIEALFNKCELLKSLDLSNWDVSKITSTYFIVAYCTALETLNLANWDLGNVTYTLYTFIGATSLKNVIGPIYNIPVSLDIHFCPLTAESAMVFINGLKDGVSGQKLTFSSTTYSQLTPEQLAVGTSKGWTIAKA